jgi:all-trans-retinol 13,14-reductase
MPFARLDDVVNCYKRFADQTSFDTIVVGSGIGGLAVAALLAMAGGQRVLVLERHYTAGGLTHAFHRPGFEWDVGVHYVGQVHQPGSPARAWFEYLTEGRLDWQPMPDIYDRVVIGDLRFDYVRGEARLRDALQKAFPAESRVIERYFKAIRQCLRRMPFFFAEKMLLPIPARLLGRALRAPFLSLASRTTADVLDDLRASPELRAVLTAQWGDYGLPPKFSSFGIHAIVTSHYFDGAAYPVGGAGQIAASLLPTIEAAGGTVIVGAEVERILVEGGRAIGVRMSDGREFHARYVVSDAGVQATFQHLLPEDVTPAVRATVGRLGGLEPSTAHVCLYAGIDEAKLTAPLDGTNLWVHPGLDFDRNYADFVQDDGAEFPFLFISFPSAKDPTFADRYPGAQTIEVVTVMPFARFAHWRQTSWHRRGDEYDALKRQLAGRLLAAMYRRVPATEGALKTWELSTPLSTRHFVGSEQGQIYGLAHSPARFRARDLRPWTPIQNLFLTGQDVSTCGVMGALTGAVTAASAMLGRNLFGIGASREAKIRTAA